jgi:hypothetical protein
MQNSANVRIPSMRWTRQELIQECVNRNIQYSYRDTKQQLLALLLRSRSVVTSVTPIQIKSIQAPSSSLSNDLLSFINPSIVISHNPGSIGPKYNPKIKPTISLPNYSKIFTGGLIRILPATNRIINLQTIFV